MEQWVAAWAMAHAPLSVMSYPGGQTYRLIIRSSVAGEKVRFRFSNRYGDRPVQIREMWACLCNADGDLYAQPQQLTVCSKRSGFLKAGGCMTSDPLALQVKPGDFIALTVFAGKGKLTSGNSIDQAKLKISRGNCAKAAVMQDQIRLKDGLIKLAEKILGLYMPRPIPLFERMDVWNGDGAQAIACFGDSLTQQGRWLRPFEAALGQRYPGRYAVLNLGITGNRITMDTSPAFPLKGFFGERGLRRADWDVPQNAGVGTVLVALGTNDMMQPGTPAASACEAVDAQVILNGLKQLCGKLIKRGFRVYVMDYIPMGLDPEDTPEKLALREEMGRRLPEVVSENRIIRCGTAIADPANPVKPLREYVGPDRSHPSPAGGEKLAAAIPLSYFE